jgi:hypothetical protein
MGHCSSSVCVKHAAVLKLQQQHEQCKAASKTMQGSSINNKNDNNKKCKAVLRTCSVMKNTSQMKW